MIDLPNPVSGEAAGSAQAPEAPAAITSGPATESAAAEQPVPPRREREFYGFLSFLNVVVIVIYVITFVTQAFQVPTPSMENTLLVGDYLLTDKVRFGKPGSLWDKVLPYRPLQRGDVAVFRFPVDPSTYLVKRVIGLPGDHIHLHRGAVYVNGNLLEEKYVVHNNPYFNPYRDEFPSWASYSSITDRNWRRTLPRYLKDGELTVPADSYFVLGDNRDDSLDSRYWGFVPRDYVVGRPLVIYMSVHHGEDAGNGNDKLVHSGQMPAHFLPVARWDRIFRLVR
jgi:signal peptidase I